MELRPDYKQTEVGVIPSGWMVKRLGDVANVDPENLGSNTSPYYAFNYISLEDVDLGMLRGYSDEMFSTAPSRARRKLQKGDILVSTVRPNLKSHLLFNIDAPHWVCSTGFSVVRCWKGIAHPRFVFFHLFEHAISRQVEMLLTGSNYPAINGGDVRALQIPLPEYDEQTAIAAALSDVDTLIGALDRLIAKKRDLKQATMQQLLTGQTRLPGFSGKWEVKRFGEMAIPRKERIDPLKVGVQEFCIELEHIEQGSGRLVGNGIAAEGSSLKSVFDAGDVLFGKLRAYLRKYWLADRRGVCSTEIWALMANQNIVSPEFLFQLVTMDQFIGVASTAYGTHMPRSDWNIVKNYEVPLPKPDEQTVIATILSDMDAEINALEARRDKTRALKQGMMQELLTGRIRLM